MSEQKQVRTVDEVVAELRTVGLTGLLKSHQHALMLLLDALVEQNPKNEKLQAAKRLVGEYRV